MISLWLSRGLALLSAMSLGLALAQQDVFEINKTLAQTMNFGNAMETRVEGSSGLYLLESDFDVLKEAGFSAIRLPVKFSAHAAKVAPFTINKRIFKRVDWAVAEALKRDMSIIIDLHHFDAVMLAPTDSREMLLAIWAQIAEHYKDAPETVVFEMLNEPHDAITPYWNEYLAETLAVIRETNPTRAVIVGPTTWNNISDLKLLELPADPNLIVTFHNYAPFEFTHQGASWVANSDDWLGTSWTGSDNEVAAMRSLFDTASQWASDHNRPLFMGEFGAFSAADIDSRVAWTRFVRQEAEARGISWAYWEYAAGFGAYNRGTKTWNPGLLDALLGSPVEADAAQPSLYQDASQPTEVRVDDLLSQMTLEEKVGQIAQVEVTRLMGEGEWDRGPLNDAWIELTVGEQQVGALLSGGGSAPIPNTPQAWAEMTGQLQNATLAASRLAIPMIYGVDAVHGHNNVLGATIYPHNIGMAATWDPDLVREVASRVAEDVQATGIHWTFAPVADLGRDLRWGRFYETFGEDPVLAAELTAASVTGFQASGTVAATLKHFVGYGVPATGIDRSPAYMSLRNLRALHLPSFQAGIEAGAKTVMVNSGSLNGVPVHASAYLLNDVLRDELGFTGVVLSDWHDIHRLVEVHRTSASYKDAVAAAINAGVDMYMIPHDAAGFTGALLELVKEGRVSEMRIDEAVRRILTLKFALGLFEDATVDAELANDTVIEAQRDLARRAATASLTLLENDGVLPLAADLETILVLGPSANTITNQMGGWTIGWQGVPAGDERPPGLTVLEAIEQTAPEAARVRYLNTTRDSEAVTAAANEADVVIVVVGEGPYAEGESEAITTTATLAPAQLELLQTLVATDTPVVAVMVSGRPLLLPEAVVKQLNGFIMAYLPGSEGGSALADVLFGNATPSGHLPFSWPYSVGQLPLAYDAPPSANRQEALYPFGYGLSYARFRTSKPELALADNIFTLSVEVENIADVVGTDLLQIYVSRPPAGVLVPERQLVGFGRVTLEPAGSKRVSLSFPYSRLAVIPGDVLGNAEAAVLPGTYTFSVNGVATSFTVNE